MVDKMKKWNRGPAYLKRETPNNRLRVKEVTLPAAFSNVLGEGLDVTALPEGHFSCIRCKGYLFECNIMGDFHRLEVGCMGCGHAYRFLFPLDCPLPPQQGRFMCYRRRDRLGRPLNHQDKGMVIIHNSGKLCVGCEACATQIIFTTKTETNLITPGETIH